MVVKNVVPPTTHMHAGPMDRTKMLLVVLNAAVTNSPHPVLQAFAIPATPTDADNVVHRPHHWVTAPRLDRTLTYMGADTVVLRTCQTNVPRMDHIRTPTDAHNVVADVFPAIPMSQT